MVTKCSNDEIIRVSGLDGTSARTSIAQERFGFRGAPPWWWHYMDAQQAPDEVPEFRWELGVDLRDDPRPPMGGDFQP